jgi:ABC-type taurine transport system ATPase subunit
MPKGGYTGYFLSQVINQAVIVCLKVIVISSDTGELIQRFTMNINFLPLNPVMISDEY